MFTKKEGALVLVLTWRDFTSLSRSMRKVCPTVANDFLKSLIGRSGMLRRYIPLVHRAGAGNGLYKAETEGPYLPHRAPA